MTDSDEKEFLAALEAVLFAAGDPLPVKSIAEVFERDEDFAEKLLADYEKTLSRRQNCGLTLRRVAGGVQLVTQEKYFPFVAKLGQTSDRRLTAPAMETLSVIAYKQPITKQEIEDIRGVRVERSIAKLLELDLIDERGRKSTIGRPILYGTTETFLRCFGLNALSDLPQLQEFAPTDIADELSEDFAPEAATSFAEEWGKDYAPETATSFADVFFAREEDFVPETAVTVNENEM